MNYYGSLHNHTDFSNLRLRDCTNRIETIIDKAIELGHSCIAITDHETVANSIKVEQYANKIKEKNPDFKVIRGNEIYLCRDGLNADNYTRGQDKFYHFILLAKDAVGHQQIREISTRAWMRAFTSYGMMRVPTYYQDLIDIIGTNPGHVVGSTACLGGALPTKLLELREDPTDVKLKNQIEIWIDQMQIIFGKNDFYLEMQPSFNKEQIYVNKQLLAISRRKDIRYIITTDSHYLTKEDRIVHKAFLNAQNGDREVDAFYASTYMMDTEELESYFEYFSKEELDAAYMSIKKIADECKEFSLLRPLKIPCLKWREFSEIEDVDLWLKRIPNLKFFIDSSYKEDNELAKALIDGIKSHDDLQNEEAWNELNDCLSDTWISSEVNKARWSAYFLNLQKTIDYCWEAGTIVGPGRGSGVGFLLLYALDIIQINSLRENTKTYRFRFLNPERVSVLDIDTDISGKKRANVLEYLRKMYGEDRVANVLTLGTEKSKSAIQTAARGLGIDVDIARYLSSMIESDRGQMRTLAQTFYGDEENGFKPNQQFVKEMTENYPELWKVSQAIEGLICRMGIHAGGIIFVDEPFTNSSALMRAPSGEIITQFELHDAEAASLIKIDMLSVEGMDRIQTCLELLAKDGRIEQKPTLRETYENAIGVYNLERDNAEMWQLLCQHKVTALFQMEGQTGIKGIESLKPESVDDLAILNSTIRLMAQNKGDEMPTDKCARFKHDHQAWINETVKYGLSDSDRDFLWEILGNSYGLCITQEQFMLLVQRPECGSFSLTWADKLRKSIAKKNPKDYEKLTEEFYKITSEKGCRENLCRYVWDVLIAMSRGYGFRKIESLYSNI